MPALASLTNADCRPMEFYDASPPAARDAEIAGCRAAHDRLLDHAGGLSEAEVRAPSALPDWTVAHVLSHLARNAEALVHVLDGVVVGQVRSMYPSRAARAAGIEEGATQPSDRLVGDVRTAVDALHERWDGLTDDQWTGAVLAHVEIPAAYTPVMRWREVEIHHADLGRPSFGWQDWSEGWLRADLPRLAALLAADEPGAARRLAAVLAGRLDGPVTLPAVLG
jgi:maleylpyruvate isomerase